MRSDGTTVDGASLSDLVAATDRALDTTLSQTAMRFHGRVAVDGEAFGWVPVFWDH